MKFNKVLLGVVGSALVLGTVAVVVPKATNKVSASEPEVAVEVNQEESQAETVNYRITLEKYIDAYSGAKGGYGEGRLVYKVNDSEEVVAVMKEEGDRQTGNFVYSYDLEVNKGDTISYKIVHTNTYSGTDLEIEEANEEVTVTESNIDESAETFRYRINYERIIQSGQNAILGDRTLVYSINGGEEKEEKMHKDMCEGDLYKWFCDIEVQKGDVVEYKVVTTYDDGTNSFLMEEGNGTVTVDKAEN